MWSPKGQTLMLLEQAGRSHLSLIDAIAPTGRLYVSGQDQAFCSEDVLNFWAYLCRRYRKRNLLVIWNGAAIHRSQAVKDW
ncbi:hypothetical protein [Fibrisoma montanum]|uniref:hypothetical protein n=1 Tax=Fibrisoma montanum TaxID=2305895 RepID=UPI0035B5DD0B